MFVERFHVNLCANANDLQKTLEMPNLELKIHPPIILILCGAIAWLISNSVAPPVPIGRPIATVFAMIAAITGVVLAASAIYQFFRLKTTIEPTKPDETSSLVTEGVFRLSRNPMYLALLLLLTGWVIYLGNLYGLLAPVIFFGYISRFQIQPEERILASKFNDAYSVYRSQVRRWI